MLSPSKSSKMVAGARRVLRVLSDEDAGFELSHIACFIHFFHSLAVAQTVEWLNHEAFLTGTCFMKAKEQVGADIYIDDAPDNIERLRAKGLYTICFPNRQ